MLIRPVVVLRLILGLAQTNIKVSEPKKDKDAKEAKAGDKPEAAAGTVACPTCHKQVVGSSPLVLVPHLRHDVLQFVGAAFAAASAGGAGAGGAGAGGPPVST